MSILVGCAGRMSDADWRERLRFPEALRVIETATTDAVPGCERPRGLVRLIRPLIVAECVVNRRGTWERLLLFDTPGDPRRPARSRQDLADVCAPITSEREAVGYLFAVWKFRRGADGILLDSYRHPASRRQFGWKRQTTGDIPLPSVVERDDGWIIDWPELQGQGSHTNLNFVTEHVARDGTVRRLGRRVIARGAPFASY